LATGKRTPADPPEMTLPELPSSYTAEPAVAQPASPMTRGNGSTSRDAPRA
jgi:hypothetical protein